MLKHKKKLGAVGTTKTPLSKGPGLRKPLKSQPVDEEDEEEVEETEEEEEEETTPTTRQAKGKPPIGKKKVSSLAAAFDSVPLSNNADNLSPGKYEAIVKDIVLQDPDAKGQSVRVHFELCDQELADSNQITTWFKIMDASGDPVEGGVRAFKATLAKLGYEPKGDELEEAFEEINEEKPGVILKIGYSKDQLGNTWQRATVDAPCDNEVIQEYKDNIPF